MIEKAKQFFETEYNLTVRTIEIIAKKEPWIVPKDTIWCGLHRCAGVAEFLDDPNINDIYYEYKEKFENLLKKY